MVRKKEEKTENKNAGTDVKKENLSLNVGGISNWCSHCENHMDNSQKAKNKSTA